MIGLLKIIVVVCAILFGSIESRLCYNMAEDPL